MLIRRMALLHTSHFDRFSHLRNQRLTNSQASCFSYFFESHPDDNENDQGHQDDSHNDPDDDSKVGSLVLGVLSASRLDI